MAIIFRQKLYINLVVIPFLHHMSAEHDCGGELANENIVRYSKT